jgi:hypothetical protein
MGQCAYDSSWHSHSHTHTKRKTAGSFDFCFGGVHHLWSWIDVLSPSTSCKLVTAATIFLFLITGEEKKMRVCDKKKIILRELFINFCGKWVYFGAKHEHLNQFESVMKVIKKRKLSKVLWLVKLCTCYVWMNDGSFVWIYFALLSLLILESMWPDHDSQYNWRAAPRKLNVFLSVRDILLKKNCPLLCCKNSKLHLFPIDCSSPWICQILSSLKLEINCEAYQPSSRQFFGRRMFIYCYFFNVHTTHYHTHFTCSFLIEKGLFHNHHESNVLGWKKSFCIRTS